MKPSGQLVDNLSKFDATIADFLSFAGLVTIKYNSTTNFNVNLWGINAVFMSSNVKVRKDSEGE